MESKVKKKKTTSSPPLPSSPGMGEKDGVRGFIHFIVQAIGPPRVGLLQKPRLPVKP
jgi:hypothetical protein